MKTFQETLQEAKDNLIEAIIPKVRYDAFKTHIATMLCNRLKLSKGKSGESNLFVDGIFSLMVDGAVVKWTTKLVKSPQRDLDESALDALEFEDGDEIYSGLVDIKYNLTDGTNDVYRVGEVAYNLTKHELSFKYPKSSTWI